MHRAAFLPLVAFFVMTPPDASSAPVITSHSAPYATVGRIERLDPALDALLAPDAAMEKLAEGFNWSEGPVWVPAMGALLFSDVPENRIYRWKAGEGVTVFHPSSGFAGGDYDGRERGSNGLTLDAKGRLVACQHGERRVARLNDDQRTFTSLADRFEGKRFNSPNDLVFDRAGNLYFTDPPYGLAPSSVRELDFHGIYRMTPDGRVTLLSKELERPNGLALSPDEKRLYVANSHPPRPILLVFDLLPGGGVGPSRVFYDTAKHVGEGRRGLPDGMKVDEKGNVWATGPGGVLVLSPDGKLLGHVLTGQATANCGWGDDGRTLYLTADGLLLRLRTKVKGAGG
jgi:gluconolactonase